jgi:hypothetical protein
MDTKNKKPFYKRWYFWAVIVLISLYFIGKSNEDSKHEEAIPTEESLNEVTEQSSAEKEQSDKSDVSAEELSAYEQKADLGARCSAFYAVASEFKVRGGQQESAEIDADVSRASKLYAEKYAEKIGGTFNAEEKIAEYTTRYKDMLVRSFQEEAKPEEVDEAQSVSKKCDESINSIVKDI